MRFTIKVFYLSLSLVINPIGMAVAQPHAKIVLTSFPILQDVTAQLVPNELSVKSLTPKGQDPHSYIPSARDTVHLQKAALILIWGLGFDGSLENFIKKAQPKAPYYVVTDKTPTLKRASEGHKHDLQDPHLWQSPARMILVTQNISRILQKEFPEYLTQIDKKTNFYVTELQKLEKHYKEEFSNLSPERRKFITPHQAFQYLAQDMGLQTESIRGTDSQSDPSAKTIQRLIQKIKQDKIVALFEEANGESRLTKRLSRESQTSIGGALYTDTFPERQGPQTYLQLIEHNLRTILTALKKDSSPSQSGP